MTARPTIRKSAGANSSLVYKRWNQALTHRLAPGLAGGREILCSAMSGHAADAPDT